LTKIRVTQVFPGSVHEAEICWYDTEGRPRWFDEMARVVAVDGDWPRPGATMIWESGPAGRGRVHERVSAYEPLAGQTVEVEDDSIEGAQRVTFTPVDEGVEVGLSLDYAIKRRSPLTALVNALFVRRPMAISLGKTLTRFGAELAESRHPSVG
jgi:hypothetical protein